MVVKGNLFVSSACGPDLQSWRHLELPELDLDFWWMLSEVLLLEPLWLTFCGWAGSL